MEEKASIINAILIVSSIFILVAAFVVSYLIYFNKKKSVLIAENNKLSEDFEQQLIKSQLEVQESTYSALGKELHDNVGQLLSSAKMLIGITERTLENPPETLTTANETLGQAINELRSLSKSLNKEWLEQFDLVENLKAEAERINPSKQIQVHLSLPDKLPLNADEQVILFRIIQEAIQNAIKHSGSANIIVSIIFDGAKLSASIKDDGNGFGSEEPKNGVGIMNMKHRAKLLGGSIEWINEKGVNVQIVVPVKNAS